MQILYSNILNNNLYNSVLLIKKLARNIYIKYPTQIYINFTLLFTSYL